MPRAASRRLRWTAIVWGLAIGALSCAENPAARHRGVGVARGPVSQVPPLGKDACAADGSEGLRRCVDRARLERDLTWIAKARASGSPHHQAVAGRCAERFAALGYRVQRQPYEGGVNVIGVRHGFTGDTRRVVLSAHYDGAPGCAAADRNASGVAALWEAARVLATSRHQRTAVVACWDGGTQGYAGSKAYAHGARERGDDIVLATVLESVGYTSDVPDSQRVPARFEEVFPDAALELVEADYRANFVMGVLDLATRPWEAPLRRHATAAGVPLRALVLTKYHKAKQRPDQRADHSSFWDAGYPALLLSDTGPFRYAASGCARGADEVKALDLAFLTKVTRVAVGVTADALEVR